MFLISTNYSPNNVLVCRSCGKKLYTKRGYILTLHFIHLIADEDDSAFLEVSRSLIDHGLSINHLIVGS